MRSDSTPASRPDTADDHDSWSAANRREFHDLLAFEGSLVRAGRLHLSTEDDHRLVLREMLRDRPPLTHQATHTMIAESFDRDSDQRSARLALLLQHVGFAQHQGTNDLFGDLARRDDQLLREIAYCKRRLTQDDLPDSVRGSYETELRMARVQRDDLYHQARVSLELQAMREERELLDDSLDDRAIFDAVSEAALTRVCQVATGLRERVPLRKVLAVEIGQERSQAPPDPVGPHVGDGPSTARTGRAR